MISPYDILGVPQNATDETIKVAFHRTAKACHPDLHAADPTAEERLREAVAAYHVLKNPEQRAAFDLQLRARRRRKARRFAVPALASLVSGGAVAFVVWLSVSPSHTEIVSSTRGRTAMPRQSGHLRFAILALPNPSWRTRSLLG